MANKLEYSVLLKIKESLPEKIVVNATDFLKTKKVLNEDGVETIVPIKDNEGNAIVTDEIIDKLLNNKTDENFFALCAVNIIPQNASETEKNHYRNEILSILEKRLLVM